MAENFEQNKAHNAELLEEAQFVLQQRTEPNIVLMSASDYRLQRKMVERLKAKLPEYQFYDIDLTPFKVVSLHKALQEHLPAKVLYSPPITFCVNVFGLENSRLASEDGKIIDSGMIAQLNYEREVVFRKPNYLTILWGDHDFFVQLQRQAPDFWSWVTYYFEFKQEEVYEEVIFEKESVPEFSARLPEREEYIRSLEAKLESLPLKDSDKSRTTQERINLYSLLAEEYAKYFDFENSCRYYDKAIGLLEQIEEKENILTKLIYDYGTLNLKFKKFDRAIVLYKRVLNNIIEQKDLINIGNTYHQIGSVYEMQGDWVNALMNYSKALDWNEKTFQLEFIGGTFHQIGMVFHQKQDWNQALESYLKAIYWNQVSKQYFQLGGSYHQIGRLYESQNIWDLALTNFNEALKWKIETNQDHEIGSTYHHIGRVYESLKDHDIALKHYQNALKWKQDTGQINELGSTYHHIGINYEKKKEWVLAIKNFESALNCYIASKQYDQMAGTYYHIGRVKEEQNQFNEALRMFVRAIHIIPDNSKQKYEMLKEAIQQVKIKISEGQSTNVHS
ncbi:tetratricopeptide repeat protein [Salmonirosea aquatica]|uniref:Tetratricopeptide repeat protein n=1 Tax=Salmonirosea aquatica TaxID=2654236 RepID=A0A7C9BGR5_9BACT|nr:tetratricopeptide repeat protein [Cytophagaceae bacterium SJW1-29]